MPVSSDEGKQYIKELLSTVKKDKILDIGVGCGTYAMLFPESDLTGVEAWQPYVEQYSLGSLYNKLIVGDVRTVEFTESYDVAIAGDVLEHMNTVDAVSVLSKLRAVADLVVISIPLGHHPQGAVNGNDYERHIEDWSDAKVRLVFGEPYKSHIDGIIGVYVYERARCVIPKTIHVVWIGDEAARPDAYINSWRDRNPGWSLRIWGNEDYEKTPWVNKAHMQTMWEAGSLHGVADMMRYEILHREGGFCVDADSECVNSLDDVLFNAKIILSYENVQTRPGLISVGYMGSVPGEKLFADIIEDIKASPSVDVAHAWHSVGPRRLTDNYERVRPADIIIHPDHMFIPNHFDAPHYTGEGKVYARQYWLTTNKQKDKKMKIVIAAIAHNEEKHVKRFCDSAKDADAIYIADTGSTDDTVKIAKECGAIVSDICVTPWRFDIARNAGLALVPRDVDIIIALDLDEVMEPGWREEIERVWIPGETTRLRYMFDWGCGIKFQYEKIFAKHGYHFHHPLHEYPRPDGRINEVYAYTNKLLVTHYPDASKSRGQYLDILKLSIQEDPICPRNAFYYARELSFYSRWEDAITECKRYLALPGATWGTERCYAYRVMGKSYEGLNRREEAERAYHQACGEAPNTREPWCALALLMYMQHRWEESFAFAMRALKIKDRELVYTCDPAVWGAQPHDLASIAAWHLGIKDIALEQAKLAVEKEPNDPRLQNNLRLIEDAILGRVEKAA